MALRCLLSALVVVCGIVDIEPKQQQQHHHHAHHHHHPHAGNIPIAAQPTLLASAAGTGTTNTPIAPMGGLHGYANNNNNAALGMPSMAVPSGRHTCTTKGSVVSMSASLLAGLGGGWGGGGGDGSDGGFGCANSLNDDDGRGSRAEFSTEEKARQNRDRNREHARSTRLRKKANVQKLKELVEGLHAERTEERFNT